MRLIDTSKKVDEEQINALSLKCLEHVQDVYPTSWKTIITKTYEPMIDAIMKRDSKDEFEAAVFLYNLVASLADKIWYMAAAKSMINNSKQ